MNSKINKINNQTIREEDRNGRLQIRYHDSLVGSESNYHWPSLRMKACSLSWPKFDHAHQFPRKWTGQCSSRWRPDDYWVRLLGQMHLLSIFLYCRTLKSQRTTHTLSLSPFPYQYHSLIFWQCRAATSTHPQPCPTVLEYDQLTFVQTTTPPLHSHTHPNIGLL